jgi:hypothetical protein
MSGSPCGGCTMRSVPSAGYIYHPMYTGPVITIAPSAACQNAASANYARRCRNVRSCEDRQSSVYRFQRERVEPQRLP